AVGVIAGGIIGAVAALIAPALGGVLLGASGIALSVGAVASGAIGGAALVGGMMASIGALSGIVTGVMQSREAASNTEQLTQVANASFAQGMVMGHQA